MKFRWMIGLVLLVMLVACSKQAEYADAESASMAEADFTSEPELPKAILKVMPANEAGLGRGKAGGMLAYEHHVTLRVTREEIQARMAAVRTACSTEKFGACTLLGESLSTGDYPSGHIQMRLVPKAVDAVVESGAKGAELAERRTSAEDLADAVRNTEMQQKRLRLHHEKLMELLARRDIKGEELLGLTSQLAEVEAQLDAATQESAQQQRRLETNLLTIEFQSIGFDTNTSQIKQAFKDFLGTMDSSLAFMIRVLAALLPFIVVLGLLIAAIRWWMKRKPRHAD